MSLTLLREAVLESKYSSTKKQTLKTIQEAVGKSAALRIVEAYNVTPEDYDKWLSVIVGYAQDNNLNIRTKASFEDVAFAVLENDPAPIDESMKEAIVATLWANHKAKMSHSKVEKAIRAKEEEEQVQYALKKMKRGMEDEQESAFSQAYKSAKGMEDEEDDTQELSPQQVVQWARQFERGDISADEFRDLVNFMSDDQESDDQFDDDDFSDEDFDNQDSDFDSDDNFGDDFDDQDSDDGEFNLDSDFEDEQFGDFDPDEEFDPNELSGDEFDDFGEDDLGDDELDFEDPRDADIMRRGRDMEHSRDLEDFDPASDEGVDRIDSIMRRGRDMERAQRLSDVEPPMRSKSKPRAFYAAEQEEMGGSKDYSSPFRNGQMVQRKKDKANFVVEIPDGPGDMVGVKIDGRLTMIPSKDLVAVNTSTEEEESTSKQPSGGKVSFLHDVLTGTNSQESMKKLQQEIETAAANAWTTHHAKMPKNPHPKGSIAYKAWEKGMTAAAKAVWAPKPVLDPKAKQKTKPKPKKR